MMVRWAEIRDISNIEFLFMQLIEYLVGIGHDFINPDFNTAHNAAMAFIVHRIMDQNSLVLVHEKDNTVDGFLIGEMQNQPAFLKHQRLGQILWIYPVSTGTRELANVFAKWAAANGATAIGNYVYAENSRAIQAMEAYGLKTYWHFLLKPLGGEQ